DSIYGVRLLKAWPMTLGFAALRPKVLSGMTGAIGGNGLSIVGMQDLKFVPVQLRISVPSGFCAGEKFCEIVKGTFCPSRFDADCCSGKYEMPYPPRMTVCPLPTRSYAKPRRGPTSPYCVDLPAVEDAPSTPA